MKRGGLDRDVHAGGAPSEHWGEAATSQETARSWERGPSSEQIPPWCLQRGHSPADTLILDFGLPTVRINLLFKLPGLWYFVKAALGS